MSQLFNTGILVSKGNSTTIPLVAGASFVGNVEDVTSFEEISINIAGSPNNAAGNFYFEFSPDEINWDVSVWVSGASLIGPNIVPQYLRVILPYFRVRYVNGNTPQTAFRLTTIYHRVSGARLTRFLNQTIDNTEGIEVTRSIIDGSRPDGTYGNIQVDANNILLANTTVPQIKIEYDMSSTTVNYIGTAPSGTLTSAAAWTIKKVTFDASGNPQQVLWSNTTAIWDNRTTIFYN